MEYPLFERITQSLLQELYARCFQVRSFRQWRDDLIRATGVEGELVCPGALEPPLFVIRLNVDWDLFREQRLAPRFLSENSVSESSSLARFRPTLDFEISWRFDRRAFSSDPYPSPEAVRTGLARLQAELARLENGLTAGILTRWHVDLSSFLDKRFVSDVLLIAYGSDDLGTLRAWSEVEAALRQRVDYIEAVSRLLQAALTDAAR
ncbi:MAG: hypothetical protein N2561_04700 [Bacteroidetes bacterium]|nr:hypothetical protein [Rhodothermia bacterium]MCS7154446.1 hypothetical protein [Bacteroidota bacterium]MCX7906819.1 hypothetical protein [Bacteroidota bacterium]MDW8136902.1 hypothetical protein [Bacteroidota bacterium]MDW8285228.1 hypothetical protein [Bacteroidota bacterium]